MSAHPAFARATWFTSSFSANGNCVEVAFGEGGAVGVRDTKDREGPTLVFTPQEWAAFVAGVRAAEFD